MNGGVNFSKKSYTLVETLKNKSFDKLRGLSHIDLPSDSHDFCIQNWRGACCGLPSNLTWQWKIHRMNHQRVCILYIYIYWCPCKSIGNLIRQSRGLCLINTSATQSLLAWQKGRAKERVRRSENVVFR